MNIFTYMYVQIIDSKLFLLHKKMEIYKIKIKLFENFNKNRSV